MDAYDQIQSGIRTPQEDGDKVETPLDRAAQKLEASVENAYSKLSSTNWSGLWNTVKARGEKAFSETKQDLKTVTEDLGSLWTDDKNGESSENLQGSTETVRGDDETPTPSTTTANNGSSMLNALTKRAQQYIDGLDRDLEKMEDAAGSYFLQIGQDVKGFLKDAVSVDAPVRSRSASYDSERGEDLPQGVLFNVPEDIRNQIYSTRLDAQLHALHTSEEPFLSPASEDVDYNAFAKTFNVEEASGKIESDLNQHAQLRSLMDTLVPEKVSYTEFWSKYYYMRTQIEQQEQKRRKVVQQAVSGENEDISWEDDEEEDDGEVGKSKSAVADKDAEASRTSSEDSYDVVSKNTSVGGSTVDLRKTATTNSGIAATKEEDDEDEDWE